MPTGEPRPDGTKSVRLDMKPARQHILRRIAIDHGQGLSMSAFVKMTIDKVIDEWMEEHPEDRLTLEAIQEAKRDQKKEKGK